jgi:hypothetical protein
MIPSLTRRNKMTRKKEEHRITIEVELTEEVLTYYENLAKECGTTVESLMEGVLKLEAMGVNNG